MVLRVGLRVGSCVERIEDPACARSGDGASVTGTGADPRSNPSHVLATVAARKGLTPAAASSPVLMGVDRCAIISLYTKMPAQC